MPSQLFDDFYEAASAANADLRRRVRGRSSLDPLLSLLSAIDFATARQPDFDAIYAAIAALPARKRAKYADAIAVLKRELCREYLTRMRWRLVSLDHGAIVEAHEKLVDAGFQFIGYHGTNQAGVMSIVPFNINPPAGGIVAGAARGDGFYVAHDNRLSEDFARGSTENPPPEPGEDLAAYRAAVKAHVPMKPGKEGLRRVLRVYASEFDAMVAHIDYDVYVMNQEEATLNPHVFALDQSRADLELVFRRSAYARLAAIPTLHRALELATFARVERAEWSAPGRPLANAVAQFANRNRR